MEKVLEEKWLTAPGMLGDYEVSNRGRLRRETPGKNTEPGRIQVTPVQNQYGHLGIVRMGDNGRKTKFYIHRLVALAFIGEPPEGQPFIRHLDSDPTNNELANLAWGSAAENSLDMLAIGHAWQANKPACPRGHPYSGDNLMLTVRKARGRNPERVCRTCSEAYRHVGLSSDSEQHGSRAGYMKGCRCAPCREAKLEYDRAWRASRN